MTKITSPDRLREIRAAYERGQAAYERRVLVCGGAGCVSCHCQEVREALEKAVDELGLGGRVKVMVTGCIGICAVGPVMVVEPDGVLYTSLDAERAALIARRHLLEGEIVEECTFYDHEQKRRIPHLKDIGFFREQVRIALRNCGQMEYASLEAYIARDGYAALAGALTRPPADVVGEIKRSGLRGRGGAGFPTGVKWEAGMNAPEGQKYMVCNADEGDPGAFMDRSILEGDPHSLIEGMMLGGYAIGANRGYVYVRAEYPLAVERLSNAIHQARDAGLLGENILGSDFNFDLEIRIGAGAFVCGEETALMNSVEGRRGEPDQKPPFPFESGDVYKRQVIHREVAQRLKALPAQIPRVFGISVQHNDFHARPPSSCPRIAAAPSARRPLSLPHMLICMPRVSHVISGPAEPKCTPDHLPLARAAAITRSKAATMSGWSNCPRMP